MRILVALSVIILSIQQGRCRIDLKRDKEVIVDIDSPELHQSQYHTADFDTSAYNYGYAVEPNGQFHHETRGGDGVTYGCYGYIDSDDLLKVTHYVADSQGYRTLEHEKPVLVYPIDENNVDAYEKPKGVMSDWKDLYFPIGRGMAKGGVLLNAPVIRAPGGIFQQLGETKFPVQPSTEPKVVVPRIPFNSGIKTEPTKLIPISTVIVPETRRPDPKTTASITFSFTGGVNPSTETTQRPTTRPSVSTKTSYNDAHVNGPEYDSKNFYRQNQQPTIQSTKSSSSHPTRFGTTPAPFRESVRVNGPSTVKAPSDTLKLQKVTSPDSSEGQGHSDYTEDLLPPFRTTNIFDIGTQTTIGLPIDSINPGNDLDVINSYANVNPESRTTTQSSYADEVTTTVPTHSQSFSNSYNNNGPSSFPSSKRPGFYSTEKITTLRPNKFDGLNFNFNTQTTTEIPIDLVTEPNSDSTNPDWTNSDSTTILTTDAESSTFSVGGPNTNQRPKDTSYQTSVKFSSNQHEPTGTRFGISSSIASKRPVVESYTTPNIILDFETSTSQSTYPGIGDYSKPQKGFEFNIPTRAPNQVFSTVSTPNPQSFVTIGDFDTVKDDDVTPNVNFVENEDPIYGRPTKFTNGPHGAEYQLGSRIPHSQYTVSNVPSNNFNFLNQIKQSRKDADAKNPPISLITPLTHLTISGSFTSKNNGIASSIGTSQSTGFATDPSTVQHSSTVQQPSTPIYSGRFPVVGSPSEVGSPHRQSTIQPERETNHLNPQQPTGFFTVTTPKSEPIRGIITHMDAISQTRFQSSRVTPSLPSVTPNDEPKSNDVIFNQPIGDYFTTGVQQNISPDIAQTSRPELVKSTEFPFLYTRSRTTSANSDNVPYQGDSGPGFSSPDLLTPTPGDKLTIYSGFGQKIIPGSNPATTSFTAYNPGSASTPVHEGDSITPSTEQTNSHKPASYENFPVQPKFVLKATGRPAPYSNRQPLSNFNGYSDAEIRNANFYPDSNPQKSGDNNHNNIQPENKYINSKKEFVPQYNPSSTPIPGSLGTAIGVYPPNVDELTPEIPSFNIAISKWPFYILPFPFTNGNIMTFPFLTGMPIQLGAANILPNFNTGTNVNSGSDYVQGASNIGSGGNGAPAQSICSWLSSFIKQNENATRTETPTNGNGETLQISNLQVNIKNPQLQVQQNQNQVPFGIVRFIPIIAVPNCQHNVQGDKLDANALPSSIQIPSLCTQLSHLLGTQINTKDTNQPLPT